MASSQLVWITDAWIINFPNSMAGPWRARAVRAPLDS